ncbi:MAG: hypothetical protein ACI9BW_002742, partial [Gammaproteobacteria bacterium]
MKKPVCSGMLKHRPSDGVANLSAEQCSDRSNL